MARRILGEDVTQIDVYPNASSGWWARFSFNGITRYERGTYDLVGGEELSDAVTWPKASVAEPLRDQLRWLRNRTIQQRTADVFVQNTTDQRLIRNAFLQGFDT